MGIEDKFNIINPLLTQTLRPAPVVSNVGLPAIPSDVPTKGFSPIPVTRLGTPASAVNFGHLAGAIPAGQSFLQAPRGENKLAKENAIQLANNKTAGSRLYINA